MANTFFANYSHNHGAHANDEGYDLAFIDAEHYDRDASCQPGNPAQRPLNGKTVIEHYASVDVPVLALPILYCLTCAVEQPCAFTHSIVKEMGVCKIEWVTDPERYVKSDRVQIVAERAYTGQVQRKS